MLRDIFDIQIEDVHMRDIWIQGLLLILKTNNIGSKQNIQILSTPKLTSTLHNMKQSVNVNTKKCNDILGTDKFDGAANNNKKKVQKIKKLIATL